MKARENSNNAYIKIIFIDLLAYILTIAVNYSSAAGLIGSSQSEVSKSFPTIITPAGFAFSIWGLIYVSILLALIIPLFTKNKLDIDSVVAISPIFWVSCLINIGWTFVFSNKIIWLSAILIILLWLNILDILLKLNRIRKNKKGLVDVAFGFYAGWLAIASVVNFLAFLVSINFGFFGNEKIFAIVCLLLFTVFSSLLQKAHKNPVYNLSIIWAFYAIGQRHGFENAIDPLFVTLTACSLMLILSLRFSIKKTKA